jgi:hypothetical protein
MGLRPRVTATVRAALQANRSARPVAIVAAKDAQAVQVEVDANGLEAADELYKRALEHRQRGELVKAERRCRQALYLAPNLLPALELLQILWSEHPNLRLRRALRDRVLRHRLPRPVVTEAAILKENA